MDLQDLELQERNDLIIRASVELLQNVMPTNIVNFLDDSSSVESTEDAVDDFDESRFFLELLQRKQKKIPLKLPQKNVAAKNGAEMAETPRTKGTHLARKKRAERESQRCVRKNDEATVEMVDMDTDDDDENGSISDASAASLTLLEIDELEMLAQLNVKPEDIQFLGHLLSSVDVVEAKWLHELGVHTIDRLTNVFVYSLMCVHDFATVDRKFSLAPGVAERVTYKVCSFIAAHKKLFFRLPNRMEIEQSVREFAAHAVHGEPEFRNIFSAVGSIDVPVTPGLVDHFSIATGSGSSATVTPVKLQCSCDANGFLQSCFVLVPAVELDTKNVEAFVQSPLYEALETRPVDGNYMVADHSFSTVPVLLTPRDTDDHRAATFNRSLESRRIVIDQAFARIRNRFSILNRIECDDPQIVRDFIVSVCVLYNVLVANDGTAYEIVD